MARKKRVSEAPVEFQLEEIRTDALVWAAEYAEKVAPESLSGIGVNSGVFKAFAISPPGSPPTAVEDPAERTTDLIPSEPDTPSESWANPRTFVGNRWNKRGLGEGGQENSVIRARVAANLADLASGPATTTQPDTDSTGFRASQTNESNQSTNTRNRSDFRNR